MAYDASNPAGDASGGQDPYNYQRNLAQQRAGGQQRANYDALQRRFANNGGMNSGAAIQAEGDANRGTQQDLENTQGAIGAEESKAQVPFQLQAQQQEFQGREAAASRAQQESQFGRSLSQENSLRSRQLDLEATKNSMDADAMKFNEGLSQWSQAHSGGLLGGGGFLGMGL